MHCWQVVAEGVPVQVGSDLNKCGGGGKSCEGALQQIWPVQSLLWLQAFGQVLAQMPLQQSGVFEFGSQSDDVEHALTQVSYAGFRQRPWLARFGSSAPAVVQQISPMVVSHCELVEHALGHSLAGVQMGVL
jgi:hypothetical protein